MDHKVTFLGVGLQLLLLASLGNGIDWTVTDVVGSIANVGSSIIDPKLLPTPDSLFQSSKNLLVGLPFEYVSSSINYLCSQALSSNKIKSKFTPDINKMNFQLRNACQRSTHPLLEAEKMWNSPEFDRNKKVVILATGWTTRVNDTDTIDGFARAYNCRGDVNFVAVDAASFVDTLYSWSAFNTDEIGKHLARGLVKLLDVVDVSKIHLIGHSLGAHIVGAAGRYLQQMANKTVPRITGLDPAKPCFNEGESLSGLLRGDATFVDVIHSNPGVLGKSDPIGDADFYPGGLSSLPNGCLTVTCAHSRAWEYFEESIYPGNEDNFLSVRCSSLSGLRKNLCVGRNYPMGFAAPTDLKGNYFLEINGNKPYGKRSTPTRAARLERCGLCP
ncbi:vitellogenin-1 [Drosophila sulfurigaster albostrigata]|uniref:vitellogenin-1 n=1 Tax=Drosophila sulfurigaster albostrigata TaxID=89887 RepID=UPI002D21952A|nr:vitellogenin-1 [Drosophila sulfurigaster albostrigata]